MSGQLLMEEKSTGSKTELDLQNFADGIYNVKITAGSSVEIHRITKQ